jgi:hypothetical protein
MVCNSRNKWANIKRAYDPKKGKIAATPQKTPKIEFRENP